MKNFIQVITFFCIITELLIRLPLLIVGELVIASNPKGIVSKKAKRAWCTFLMGYARFLVCFKLNEPYSSLYFWLTIFSFSYMVCNNINLFDIVSNIVPNLGNENLPPQGSSDGVDKKFLDFVKKFKNENLPHESSDGLNKKLPNFKVEDHQKDQITHTEVKKNINFFLLVIFGSVFTFILVDTILNNFK